MSNNLFLPLNEPPDDDAGADALWFCVRGESTVLVCDADHAADDPAPLYLGILDGRHCWSVDAGDDHAGDFVDLRALYGRVDEVTWTIAGRAVQLVAWDRTHRYCGRCGTPTEESQGERAKRCPVCGLLAFPRLAPAVIVLVTRDDELLLARNANFPVAMYSTIAGFVEPGETLEEAVRREVKEEVGVEVGDVRYFASQPWPFPHSLMLGFTATWASGDVVVDEREIADARWFHRDALPMIPPAMSIARRLIDSFVT
jgi:NAD+ diphosphatase